VTKSFLTGITSTGMQNKAFNKKGNEPSLFGEKERREKESNSSSEDTFSKTLNFIANTKRVGKAPQKGAFFSHLTLHINCEFLCPIQQFIFYCLKSQFMTLVFPGLIHKS
jgi:hypothetical protein